MNLSRVTRTRYRTKRNEPGGVRKLSKCKKIYPRLAANGARVATRGAREGQKLHILPFITGITCSSSSNSSLSIERKEEQIVHIKTPNLHVWLAPHTPPPPPLIYNFYIKRIRKPT
jgi:hypothetical protein